MRQHFVLEAETELIADHAVLPSQTRRVVGKSYTSKTSPSVDANNNLTQPI